MATLRQPFIIQEYVETGGTDIRAIVIGNRVAASMKRKASSMEARANFHAGGTGEPVELDTMTKKLAVDVAKAIRSEICAVDILQSARGPLVIEANISPGLQLISATTKIDVADIIANYLYERTIELRGKKKELEAAKIIKGIDEKKSWGEKRKIITTLDFRGNMILLPELITRSTGFEPDDNFEIDMEPDKVSIKKLKIERE